MTDWEKTTKAMEAAEAVVNGLVKFTQARQNNKTHDFSQVTIKNNFILSIASPPSPPFLALQQPIQDEHVQGYAAKGGVPARTQLYVRSFRGGNGAVHS